MNDEKKTVCTESYLCTSREEQEDVWNRLPLTAEQRVRVLAAMRKAKDEEEAEHETVEPEQPIVAMSDLD